MKSAGDVDVPAMGGIARGVLNPRMSRGAKIGSML